MSNRSILIISILASLFVIGVIITLYVMLGPGYLQLYEIIITVIGIAITLPTIMISLNKYSTEQQKATKRYLDLYLQINYIKNYVSIKTQVINRTNDKQDIEFAFILISPQENWDKIMIYISEKYHINFNCTNDFIKLKDYIKEPLYCTDGVIIPLPFYYQENLVIGDESPAFVYTLDNNISKLRPGIYSVRFYIYPNAQRYHRTTVDSFILSNAD